MNFQVAELRSSGWFTTAAQYVAGGNCLAMLDVSRKARSVPISQYSHVRSYHRSSVIEAYQRQGLSPVQFILSRDFLTHWLSNVFVKFDT